MACKYTINFIYNLICSLSQVASVPVSWPDFSVANKTSEKRKPQSASPPRQSSVMRMKRFQKSTAIYTLPARGATKRAGNLSRKYNFCYFYKFKEFYKRETKVKRQ